MRSQTAIVDATNELLAEVGYRKLTMGAVAARAGVAKSTVYRWWPTKVRLVVEAVTSAGAPLDQPPPDVLAIGVRELTRWAITVFISASLDHILPEMATDLDADQRARTQLRHALSSRRVDAAAPGTEPDRRRVREVDPTLVLDVICGTVIYRRLMARDVDRLGERLAELITARTPMGDRGGSAAGRWATTLDDVPGTG